MTSINQDFTDSFNRRLLKKKKHRLGIEFRLLALKGQSMDTAASWIIHDMFFSLMAHNLKRHTE